VDSTVREVSRKLILATAQARPSKPGTSARRDPKRRRRAYQFDPTRLENRDPNKFYKLIAPNLVRRYESLGMTVEPLREGGPTMQVGAISRPGEPVMMDEHILMSMPMEEHERVELEGQHGGMGQEYYDDLEDQILAKDGGIDPARGMRSRFAHVLNETKPNFYGTETE
jgi:hypothetical protein